MEATCGLPPSPYNFGYLAGVIRAARGLLGGIWQTLSHVIGARLTRLYIGWRMTLLTMRSARVRATRHGWVVTDRKRSHCNSTQRLRDTLE